MQTLCQDRFYQFRFLRLLDENATIAAEKQMDLYEDEALMHFVKYGQHSKGMGSKTVKRVIKLSPFYKYDGKTFFHIRRDEEWKIIPKLEDRRDIIEKAHVLGHFQVDTTFDRLREKYYWKNMGKYRDRNIKMY